MFPFVLYPPSFEVVYSYICGRRRLAVARYQIICLVLIPILHQSKGPIIFTRKSNGNKREIMKINTRYYPNSAPLGIILIHQHFYTVVGNFELRIFTNAFFFFKFDQMVTTNARIYAKINAFVAWAKIPLDFHVGLRDFCHRLTLLPPGASLFHKHMCS